MSGPLAGLKVLEVSSIGPGPFCGMMLADQGADVIAVDRPGGSPMAIGDKEIMRRSRRSIVLDLKAAQDVTLFKRMAAKVDILIEGFRPGVMERLGLGPDVLLQCNPRLVYVRITGWGREGPLASLPGHDLNYLSLAGAVHHLGRAGERPTFPANLLGDYGAGGMFAAFGALAAIYQAAKSGTGQVVDVSMVDGAAVLMTILHEMRVNGRWSDYRGSNVLDSGAPYYEIYETSDGRYISVAAAEPQFYARLIQLIGLEDDPLMASQAHPCDWAEQKASIESIFRTRTRDEWCDLLGMEEICFAPVLSMEEAPQHPQNIANATFVEAFGLTQAAPAPRFSRSGSRHPSPPPRLDQDRAAILAELGISSVAAP